MPISKKSPMACGGCGGIEFRLFHHTEGIATQCRKCTALSVITVQPAEIKVEWPSMLGKEIDGEGLLVYRPGR